MGHWAGFAGAPPCLLQHNSLEPQSEKPPSPHLTDAEPRRGSDLARVAGLARSRAGWGARGLAPRICTHGPPCPPRCPRSPAEDGSWFFSARPPPRGSAGGRGWGVTRGTLGPPGRLALADAPGLPSGQGSGGCGGLEPPRRARPACGPRALGLDPSDRERRRPLGARQQPAGREEPALSGAARGPSTPAPEKPTASWVLFRPLALRSLGTF